MLTGLKYALSRKIHVVASEIHDSNPPNTPPIHIPVSVLQIIRSSADSLRSTPSKVTNGVPSGNVLTVTLLPVILSASKACKG